jgi:ATP-dependent DNA helicase RecG
MDLQERGMGQLAGSRQSGGIAVRFTDFSKDDDLIVASRKSALHLIEEDPVLSQKRHLKLRKRLERRYERGMELFRVG